MSAAEEQPVVSTEETKPVEAAAPETPAVETTPAETTPEMAILAKDPEVVKSDLEKAEPVTAEPSAPEAAATTEETPVEPTPPTGEKHKEGSTLLGFIKKVVPNPKTTDKGKAKAATSEIEPIPAETAPAAAAPAVTETADEKPFEGDYVEFKTHGGFFSGGWKRRELKFGQEDGYGQNALLPYIGIHKVTTLVSTEKANACWDTAAHATVTGVGLLFVVKSRALDVPLNIINLATVTGVSVQNNHFTVKTELMGDYEFTSSSPEKAQKWKTEIETRVEQSKLTRSGVQEAEKYKENYAYFKEGKAAAPAKASEAVTSDEEAGAVSGEESKRPGKWTRRISGSFQKITGGSSSASKEQAPEAPKATEAPKDIPAATDTVEPATVAAETAPDETPAVDAPETSDAAKKEKRKSFTGFATGLWKTKAVSKEPSPEPTAAKDVTEETPAVAPTETPAAAPEETPAETTDEAQPAPPTETKEKNKRGSIFLNLLPKKESKEKSTTTAPLTNGEAATEEAVTTSSDAVFPSATEEAEVKPPTPKKDSLGRRLTSQFKSLGRSKSPEKGKATKVSDEAPKIDTAIETTPQPPTTSDPAVVEPEVKVEEPLLGTTEAPAPSAEALTTTEQPSVPAVTTQA